MYWKYRKLLMKSGMVLGKKISYPSNTAGFGIRFKRTQQIPNRFQITKKSTFRAGYTTIDPSWCTNRILYVIDVSHERLGERFWPLDRECNLELNCIIHKDLRPTSHYKALHFRGSGRADDLVGAAGIKLFLQDVLIYLFSHKFKQKSNHKSGVVEYDRPKNI